MRCLLTLLLTTALGACTNPGRDDGATTREVREVRALDTATEPGTAVVLPNKVGTVKFAVIGDSGRGNQAQYDIAAQMIAWREQFPFAFVLMNGDNIYEGLATAEDYREKFEKPYKQLLDDGVKFFAALGNHDDPRQVDYPLFNMRGHRYYTFRAPEDPLTRLLTSVRFFALDTVTLDGGQLQWVDEQLRRSGAEWKICFFHHPMYTSGRYQNASAAFRAALEPIFMRAGVDVVFAGHEHFYMRSTLQNGIQYFVSGGAGSLREGDSNPRPFVAQAFDADYHFMLVEIEREVMSFQVVARSGQTVDSGALHRRRITSSADTADPRQPRAPVP